MVEYAEWNRAVHTKFKEMGGNYQSDADVVKAITRAAARWWNENKKEIKRFTFRQAVDFAEKLIEELVREGILDAR